MGEAEQAGIGCNDACVKYMACGFDVRWRLRSDIAGCSMACAQLACWSGGGGPGCPTACGQVRKHVVDAVLRVDVL